MMLPSDFRAIKMGCQELTALLSTPAEQRWRGSVCWVVLTEQTIESRRTRRVRQQLDAAKNREEERVYSLTNLTFQVLGFTGQDG